MSVHMLILLLVVALVPARALAQPGRVSYQGELTSQGLPFEGTAQFKFAIVCGTTIVWSNDPTAPAGSEPSRSVAVDVVGGVFSVLLGDPSQGMNPIFADALAVCSNPALRTWVDTGNGFEQLADQPLASSPFALSAVEAKRASDSFSVNGFLSVRDQQGSRVFLIDPVSREVTLDAIRFSDGTLQTTAPSGAGSADSDWIFSGTNLYAGVSGNVGIGTGSPNSKLHVQTPVGEPVRLNLRSGGSWPLLLEQDPESLFSITNGGQRRLAIGANGNIGIGTTTPTARLDVAGSTVVRGDLTVDGNLVGGGILSIPTSALEPAQDDMSFLRTLVYLEGATNGASVVFDAPIQLPHGVTITQLRAFVFDTATGAIRVRLNRLSIIDRSVATLVDVSSTDGGHQTLLAQPDVVVDNENYFYQLRLSWTHPTDVSQDLVVYGATIRYAP